MNVPNHQTETNRAQTALVSLAYCALFVALAALPWEVYQRTPFGFTLTRIAGLGAITFASAYWLLFDRRIRLTMQLAAPIALFLAVGAITCLYSLDRSASIDRLKLYALYAALFFAVAYIAVDSTRVRQLLVVFIASSGMVAFVTVLCYANWLWPMSWKPSSWTIQQLIVEFRDGVPMRMAATALDLNLPAMFFASSFGAALMLFGKERRRISQWCGLGVLSTLLIAATAISMSRSAILVFAVFAALFLYRMRARKLGVLLVILAIAFGAGFLLRANDSLREVFLARGNVNAAGDASSVQGRVEVYRIAVGLLPRYGVQGAGLAASTEALERSRPDETMSMVIHSTPLLLWIELGIVGLLAYFWLIYAFFQTIRKGYAASNSNEDSNLGMALVAVGASLFLINLFQPFVAQNLYPFLAGIACGPALQLRAPRSTTAPSRWPATLALTTVGLVVIANVLVYQNTVSRVLRYNDASTAGHAFERAAEWDQAAVQFANASMIASADKFAGTPEMPEETFYDIAADLIGLSWLHEGMGISAASEIAPSTAALHAEGQVLLLAGNTRQAALTINQATSRDIRFAAARFGVAEAQWRQGRYADAIRLYGDAAITTDGAALSIAHQQFVHGLVEESELLKPNSDIPSRIERARLLRKLGKWDVARQIYESVLDDEPNHPDALFHRGVAAEVGGQLDRAKACYAKVLEALPNHFDARKRLEALTVLGGFANESGAGDGN